MDVPWGPGTATGIGSLPFDDPDEAARIVFGELADFPHVPELPRRGPGADMTGRAAALLVDLHVDLQPSGWRLVDRAGTDERRARSWLRADLDALEIAGYGYAGPLKVQVCGPLTLAATVERNRGGAAVADAGARRDFAQSLAEGVAEHLGEVARRVPGAHVVLQLDEPALPTVLAGQVPTVSGLGSVPAVEPVEVQTLLTTVVEAAAVPVVAHCCAADPPIEVLHRAGAEAVALDVSVLGIAAVAELAEAVDTGLGLWAGVVPVLRPASAPPASSAWSDGRASSDGQASDGRVPDGRVSDTALAERVVELWRRLDQNPASLPGRTVVTPACGLAGADPAWAREAYRLARSTARALVDQAQA